MFLEGYGWGQVLAIHFNLWPSFQNDIADMDGQQNHLSLTLTVQKNKKWRPVTIIKTGSNRKALRVG